MSDTPAQYTATAKTLHWLMALLIGCMLLLGWMMTTDIFLDGPRKSVALHIHESLGMIILGLGILRLMWRFTNRPPQLPSTVPRWERAAAHAGHAVLYVLLIAMPLVGWAIISTFPHNALFFGLFPIPNLPVLPELPNKKDIRAILINIHWTLAWAILGFVALHAGAALKHHFIERDDVLLRMTPRFLAKGLRYLRGETGA